MFKAGLASVQLLLQHFGASLHELPVQDMLQKLKEEVLRIWKEGKAVIFDVDVKGGLALKKYFGDQALAIFVKVPSLDVLESRLNDRGTETEESLSRRIYKAKFEMTFEGQFDVTVFNDDFTRSSADAVALVTEFLK